ncbi:MAG TPA: DNA ligase D [Nitrososphaeraceae archaeon]|jgi:bifunctional non-homologous end joining protein LigD|nr:DNA ligase D [Nitrososphaeraceae archaeon]
MLEKYNRRRNFAKTPEPVGTANDRQINNNSRHFVIQKHNARRLHYDFRLETENGVLKSWAVPKGISLNPKIKRLAILTEDHPLDYLLFEGTIPHGNYGAGTVLVWDTGIYMLEKSSEKFSDQFDKGKITFGLQGHKVNGKFSLVRTGRENQWLLIKYSDQFASEEDLTSSRPDSILSQTKKNTLNKKPSDNSEFSSLQVNSRIRQRSETANEIELQYLTEIGVQSEFPNKIKPMLSTPVDKPFNDKKWEFEIKWDGVRAVLFYSKSRNILELKSRTNKSIRHRYPEIIDSVMSSSILKCKDSVVLDGEIVILDNQGHPDFQSHQRRMNIDHDLDIQHLSKEIPSTFYVFDILYLDGKNLENLEFWKRRELLSSTIDLRRSDKNVIRISESFEGNGIELFENIKALNLEGIIAKNKNSKYLQGARTTDWLKVKNSRTQDCVVIGYTRGEGNRSGYFGSLLLAAFDGELVFVGHSGSGFDLSQIIEIFNKLQEIETNEIPVSYIPYVNRDPVWVRPLLVVEVKFDGWTKDTIMRAPIFLRIRDDKKPQECTLEKTKSIDELSNVKLQNHNYNYKERSISLSSSALSSSSRAPSSERSPSPPAVVQPNTPSTGAAMRVQNSFSNLDKIFWPKNRFHDDLTKGDLIEYYDKISDYLLPLLKDRPLSLSRYPDGIMGKHFYQKNWNMDKPEFVNSVKIYSETAERSTNYLFCNNKETLLWLANLGCIEIHPWYSRIVDYKACLKGSNELYEDKCGLNHPDFIVFDLDPYIYSGLETSSDQEPTYNRRAFIATVKVAQMLKSEIFDILKIKSYIKTSGRTGIHIFVPVTAEYTYDQTRSFAEIIGRTLVNKHPDLITTDWNTTKRRGKIFLDYNQNAKGKTLASAFSARPTPLATISMPLEWDIIDQVLPPEFTIQGVKEKTADKKGFKKLLSCWSDIFGSRQDLSKLLERDSSR